MSARLVAEFEVDGVPVAQGSKSGYVVGKRAVVTDSNRAVLKPWRSQIAAAAQAAHAGDRIEGPVLLVVEFRFVRPKSVKREWPSVKPDIDKLERALLDGITDSGIWRDDAQVVEIRSSKLYADRPGIWVQIGEFSNTQPKETKQ